MGLLCLCVFWQSKSQRGDIRLATCGHLSDVIHAYAFMHLIPRDAHTHLQIHIVTQVHEHTRTHTDTKRKLSAMRIRKLWHCRAGIWTIFANKLADVKRL